MNNHNKDIESLLKEKRVFKPLKEYSREARIENFAQYRRMYRESISRPDKFWTREANELVWQKRWRRVLEWKPPFAKWFIGGKLNLSENCLDRHLTTNRRNKAAILWEGEPGERRTLTYQQLHREVCRFANVLKRNKIGKGDRVIIYMPTTPEVAIAMLACARIGAVHSVVFGGFSAESIRDRIADSGAIAIITADGSYRRGGIVPLKKNVDDALRGAARARSVKRVIVFQRAHNEIHMEEGRDVWWQRELEYVDDVCLPTPVDSEHPLYILYTSGSTGKPKGILHTTGGYLVGIYSTTKYVFDLREEDIYWCTADVGWVTGHSYVVYGPLANGATTFMYEGAPNWPEPDRFWRIISQNKINVLYT
ncbi:MAG TPA: AMP-binding protein, partial [Chthoniobacterales bacterium]|nr:AMP-binding protein [Chthoniobacterales bacterium]